MDKYDCRRRMKFEPNSRYIGYVGTFSHLHHPEQAIESLHKVKKVREDVMLVMVGEGPLKKKCEQMVIDYNLDKNVIFTGSLKYEDVAIAINCFDIGLILASRLRLEREGIVAFKLWEFLACGCPTIAQYKDQRDYEKFCSFMKMVHIDDKSGLSNGIIELLEDSDKSFQLADNALHFMKRNISWKKSAVLSHNFINKMIKPTKDFI